MCPPFIFMLVSRASAPFKLALAPLSNCIPICATGQAQVAQFMKILTSQKRLPEAFHKKVTFGNPVTARQFIAVTH